MKSSTLNRKSPIFSDMTILSLSERIQKILDAGFTQIQLANAAGVSKGTVNQWKDGKIKSIKLDHALGIVELTGYSAAWIVLGKGEAIPKRSTIVEITNLSDDEIELIKNYRLINNSAKTLVSMSIIAYKSQYPADPSALAASDNT